MADRIQQRRDTKARWTLYNPILLEGETGYELDTDQYKVGDGVHAWNDLPYRGDPCLDQLGQSTTTPVSQKVTTDIVGGLNVSRLYPIIESETQTRDVFNSTTEARNQIPTFLRTPGVIIAYKLLLPDNSVYWVSEQFLGSYSAANWITDNLWRNTPRAIDAVNERADAIYKENKDIFNPKRDTDALKISDKEGNIIAIIDYNGVDAPNIRLIQENLDKLPSAEALSEIIVNIGKKFANYDKYINANNSALYLVDSNNQIIFKVDKEGMHDVNFYPQDNDRFVLADKEGNIIMRVNQNGLATPSQQDTDNEAFYIADGQGNIIFKADSNGVNYVGKGGGEVVTTVGASEAFLDADVNMLISYGQSLSVAGSSSVGVDMSPAVQFKGGLRVDYTLENSQDPTFVKDYFGDAFQACAGTGFENTVKRMMLSWMGLLKNENKFDLSKLGYVFLGQAPGVSGSAISGLQKGTAAYTRLVQAVEAGKRIANANNQTFACSCLLWIQGESDYRTATVDSYYNALKTLFTNLNADIKAVTGQTKDVQFMCYQAASYTDFGTNSTKNTMVATMKLISEEENVHLGCTMYQLTYSDQLHLQNNGYLMMGAIAGVQAKRCLTDEKPMPSILPKNIQVFQKGDGSGGYLIEIKYDVPVKPLVFDVSGGFYTNPNGAQPNYGFSIESIFNVTEMYPLAGNANYTAAAARSAVPEKSRTLNRVIKYQTGASTWVTEKFFQGDPSTDWDNAANWQTVSDVSVELIDNVNITRQDTVVISTTDDPRGLVLNYAKTGKLGGGNLRDSQGNIVKVNIAGVATEVHNWAPIFAEIV